MILTVIKEKGQDAQHYHGKLYDKITEIFNSATLHTTDTPFDVKVIMENGDIEEFSVEEITFAPCGRFDQDALTIDLKDIYVTDENRRDIFSTSLEDVKEIKFYLNRYF